MANVTAFGFSPAGRIALDLGASTGGFTQVLLEGGAEKVYAIDVGHAQLHDSIKSDPRVVSLERTDARTLDRDLIAEPVMAIVADVSFISLEKALPAALQLAGPGAWLVALIKPQFEADGPSLIGKGGVVRDAAVREQAIERVARFIKSVPGWRVSGTLPSPIEGGSGNIEYLLGAVLDV